MTVTTRDPWSDAHAVATEQVLERDLAVVRRKLWVRRTSGLALGCAALLAAWWLLDRVIEPSTEDLWSSSASLSHAGFGLAVVGFVLILLGNVRASSKGVKRPFVGPDAFLSRADRAWLRTQVAEGQPVPGERHAVVAAAAHQMVGEATFPPPDLGLTLFFVGMGLASPSPGMVLPFSAFAAWTLVRMVRTSIWARRARRWLALDDEQVAVPEQ